MPPTEHLSKQYDADLEALRNQVLRMGGLVERQILDAVEGFTTGDAVRLDQVIETEREVNRYEVTMDEDCAHLIARRQPTASDLRLVLSISKTVTDLERIGDEAKKIARMAKQVIARDGMQIRLTDISHSADRAVEMLRQTLNAYARFDAKEAARIIQEDENIDQEFRAILRQLITFMMEDPRTISTALDIIWMAKAIERIGDHTKNIAQYVIFVAEGTDVRHSASLAVPRVA